ncbi:hypothetical protein [Porcipelethomonas sp.]|uniref:hypothetical protein n=1 Tax=Porcipelethomonas sp. TaxID=2981675 RepID=UPI003076973E
MTDLEKELLTYSIDDLNLILETQQDLYSENDLKMIKSELKRKENIERQKILDRLPKEIECPKCEMVSPFENDRCIYCQYEFDKSKYFEDEYYEIDNQDEENGQGHIFQYIASFLVPLVGFILGACLMAKDDENDRSTGKTCVIIGIISMLISIILCMLMWR